MEILKPSSARVGEQLARILASPQFRESPRLQTFLQFVVALMLEGKADQIKESTISTEVFRRVEMSDDSIVRSAARRLRTRLEEYYQQAGARDPVHIVIPKGSYVPEIEEWPSQNLPREEQISGKPSDSSESFLPGFGVAPSGSSGTSRRGGKLRRVILAAVLFTICSAVAILWRDRTPTGHRPNLEAQELYLKGRYYWSKRTPDDLNRAVDYFTQAVVKDPGDAEAYAGLADSYNLLSEYTVMPYQEAFRRAIAAAQTATQLDSSLAEAHTSLAFAAFYGAWDATAAEREFRRALQLKPNYATAHHWFATFLMSVGREHEALTEIERAQTLDASSKSILADKALILMYAGQVVAAKALLEEVGARDPEFLSPHRYLANLYRLEKRYPDYLSELRKIALLSGDTKGLAVVEAGEKGLAAGNATNMLTRMLWTQESSSSGQAARNYSLAETCALLGNKSKAMQYLQLAFDRHDINLVVLTVDPCFAQMRDDPAFRKLVGRVGVARQALTLANLTRQ